MYTPEGITHWGKMFRFFLFGLVESISEIFFSLFSGKSWREGATPRGARSLYSRGGSRAPRGPNQISLTRKNIHLVLYRVYTVQCTYTPHTPKFPGGIWANVFLSMGEEGGDKEGGLGRGWKLFVHCVLCCSMVAVVQ